MRNSGPRRHPGPRWPSGCSPVLAGQAPRGPNGLACTTKQSSQGASSRRWKRARIRRGPPRPCGGAGSYLLQKNIPPARGTAHYAYTGAVLFPGDPRCPRRAGLIAKKSRVRIHAARRDADSSMTLSDMPAAALDESRNRRPYFRTGNQGRARTPASRPVGFIGVWFSLFTSRNPFRECRNFDP